jgi:uncharacterized protein (DUF433 family)
VAQHLPANRPLHAAGTADWLDASPEKPHVLNMSAIAETPATELGAMIVHTPGILGGKPRIKGHRIAVHRVAGWWKLGLTIEEIGERLSALAPAEIHAALAYYHLHREEIESCLEDERAVCQSLQRKRSAQARAR